MTARPAAGAVLFIAVVSAAVVAQQPQLPARDLPRQQQATTGTGVIAGVVRAADTGMPIRGADIRLTGTGAPGNPRGAQTGADGRYEFVGLPDGQYTLVASKVRYMTMTYGQTRVGEEGRSVEVARGQRADNIDFALPAGAVIVLRIGNRFGDPAVGYRVNLFQAKPSAGARALAPIGNVSLGTMTDDRGEIRLSGLPPGDYYVSAELSLPPSLSSGADREVTTFYPGTPAEADAQPITVGLGEEVVYAFDTVVARTARISGTISGSSVGSARPELRIERRTPAGLTILDILHEVAANGSFSRANLSPGEYVFTARTEKELASVTVQLGNEDIDGLVLTMRPVQPIRGRITFEGTAPTGVAQTAFVLSPVLESGSLATIAQYKPDWTFEIAAPNGAGVLRTRTLPSGWFLKAVMLDGRDVTDTVANFETYQGKRLEVVLTQTATEITGRVADAAGREVTNYVAVAFAEDSRQWTKLSRAVASVRPDQAGRFSIRGLPPGRYLVAAVDYLPSGQERDPKVLDRLRPGAAPVALTEGATQNVTIRADPKEFR